MSKIAATVAVAAALLSGAAVAHPAKPTIVLAHGAFADSSSWNGVIAILQKDGFRTVSVAAAQLVGRRASGVDVVASISDPVVLVGRSYGGQVISNAVKGRDNVKPLVHFAALAPDAGEPSCWQVCGRDTR